jgi:hypothetical protein
VPMAGFGVWLWGCRKSPFLVGKSTVSMAMFNSCLCVYQRVSNSGKPMSIRCFLLPECLPWLMCTNENEIQISEDEGFNYKMRFQIPQVEDSNIEIGN